MSLGMRATCICMHVSMDISMGMSMDIHEYIHGYIQALAHGCGFMDKIRVLAQGGRSRLSGGS